MRACHESSGEVYCCEACYMFLWYISNKILQTAALVSVDGTWWHGHNEHKRVSPDPGVLWKGQKMGTAWIRKMEKSPPQVHLHRNISLLYPLLYKSDVRVALHPFVYFFFYVTPPQSLFHTDWVFRLSNDSGVWTKQIWHDRWTLRGNIQLLCL